MTAQNPLGLSRPGECSITRIIEGARVTSRPSYWPPVLSRSCTAGMFASMPDFTLDTQGLTCPLPILKAKKAMSGLAPGAVLEILATDPGASDDFEAFCRLTGHTLLERSDTAGIYRFLIRHTASV